MVTKYGMSERIGTITLGQNQEEVFLGRDFAQSKEYSEETANIIDEEVKSIIDFAYKKAAEIQRFQLLFISDSLGNFSDSLILPVRSTNKSPAFLPTRYPYGRPPVGLPCLQKSSWELRKLNKPGPKKHHHRSKQGRCIRLLQ